MGQMLYYFLFIKNNIAVYIILLTPFYYLFYIIKTSKKTIKLKVKNMKKLFLLLLMPLEVLMVSAQNNDNVLVVELRDGLSFKMIKVTGGTFQMGSTNGEEREQPVHSVTLSDYYIGETEVTQELWLAVMDEAPDGCGYWMYGSGADRPAYYVTWYQSQEFIKKLNEMTGRTFRLPTEAEWEFAARGGNQSKGYNFSGSNNIDDVAWYILNSNLTTPPVAKKTPNELGLYDMSGNLWEWCSDWYTPYSNEAQTNPTGADRGRARILRGGFWDSGETYCRVAYRRATDPRNQDPGIGFRLALQ